MRRIRASFLLRCVILAFCAALLCGVVFLGMETGWTIATLAVAAVLGFAAVEFGILPHLIERAAVRRAARSGKPVSSIWFVDLDEEDRREWDRFHDDPPGNPTIR